MSWEQRQRQAMRYEYRETREKKHIVELLKGFRGYLQSDGYGSSDLWSAESAAEKDLAGVVYVGCFAHMRRRFFEAMKISTQPGLADAALSQIQGLYTVERELRKNWVMSGSPVGASNRRFASSCELYALIETAKSNGWNPFKYLSKIFEKAAPMKPTDDWRQLLPWNLVP